MLLSSRRDKAITVCQTSRWKVMIKEQRKHFGSDVARSSKRKARWLGRSVVTFLILAGERLHIKIKNIDA